MVLNEEKNAEAAAWDGLGGPSQGDERAGDQRRLREPGRRLQSGIAERVAAGGPPNLRNAGHDLKPRPVRLRIAQEVEDGRAGPMRGSRGEDISVTEGKAVLRQSNATGIIRESHIELSH